MTSWAASRPREWPSTSGRADPGPGSRAAALVAGAIRASSPSVRRAGGGARRRLQGRPGHFRRRAGGPGHRHIHMPVWTGIGHTGDQSVADEVANRSFITPTECGQELARTGPRILAARSRTRADYRQAGRRQLATPSGHSTGSAMAATGARSQTRPPRRPTGPPGPPCAGRRGPGRCPRRHLASAGSGLAVATRSLSATAWAPGGRAGRLAALPDAGSGPRSAHRASGGDCSAPTTTSGSSNGATRSPATPRDGGPVGRRAGPGAAPASPGSADGEVVSTVTDQGTGTGPTPGGPNRRHDEGTQ